MSDNISSYPLPSTPILKSIILGPENQEFAHEIVRQSLMLPAGSPLYKDIIRGAIHIVGVWILRRRKATYLRKSLQNLLSLISQNDASTTPASTQLSASSFTSKYSDTNVYLR
ncbi:3805_t:CDS:2, partial [Funneliformis mosseae]